MIIVRAPVRISFGGGGTDLAAYYEQWGGFVVSAAITRYSYVAVHKPAAAETSIDSVDYQVREVFKSGALPPVAEPLSLPKAALERFAEGLRAQGAALRLGSDVAPGTGLGSSSAMAVALVKALARYVDRPLTVEEVATEACRLEIERLGMPIGKQDQYASAYGGLNTMHFTAHGVRVEPLPLASDFVHAFREHLLLFATGKARNSATILRQQRSETQSNPAVVEGLHQIKALGQEMHGALLRQDLAQFGRLLDHAWRAKRQLSGRISSQAIDEWYTVAQRAGANGGKITGAGGGGHLLLFCPPQQQAAVRRALQQKGLRELDDWYFDWDGVRQIGHVPAVFERRSALSPPANGHV